MLYLCEGEDKSKSKSIFLVSKVYATSPRLMEKDMDNRSGAYGKNSYNLFSLEEMAGCHDIAGENDNATPGNWFPERFQPFSSSSGCTQNQYTKYIHTDI